MSTSKKSYLDLASHYQKRLVEHGDTAQGMDWPREKDNQKRFQVMLDLFEKDLSASTPTRIIDFGCGTSHFYEYLQKKNVARKITYTGVDILAESIRISKSKFPKNRYLCADILSSRLKIPQVDYVTINGVFTQKRTMTDRQMKEFLGQVLLKLFQSTRKGLAFNTMSNQVDFKRRAAFHLDLNWAAKFFTRELTRHFLIRHDYGLYENTFYLFKEEYRP